MRVIRMIFVGLLLVACVVLALANRAPVTVNAFPIELEPWLAPRIGAGWHVTVPLFLVIFAAVLLGILLGLAWEWLRAQQLRSESARRTRDIAELEREVALRRTAGDEVLSLLDDRPVPAAAAARPSPATAGALPPPRA